MKIVAISTLYYLSFRMKTNVCTSELLNEWKCQCSTSSIPLCCWDLAQERISTRIFYVVVYV